jgi:hypothetical protein
MVSIYNIKLSIKQGLYLDDVGNICNIFDSLIEHLDELNQDGIAK